MSSRATWPLGLVAFALAACAPPPDPQAAVVPVRASNYEIPYNAVTFLDPTMERQFTVEANGARRSPTNTLEVYFTIRSRADAPTRLTARARFFDAEKRPLEETRFSEFFLDPRGLKNQSILSTSAAAAYYIVEVQRTR